MSLKNAIRKAGLTEEEFLKLLQGVEDMEYTVILHPAEESGYWSEIPALPGCYSQGETVEETLSKTQNAIESHIEALKEDGQDIPVESGFIIGKVGVKVA